MNAAKKSFAFGKKVGMTQVFNEDGKVIGVTVIEVSKCTVVQLKTEEKEGYSAVKVAYGAVSSKNLNNPDSGLFLKLDLPLQKNVKEIRVMSNDINKYNIGQVISVEDMFKPGDKIDVIGRAKGKGFQGVIKRHNQSEGPKSHGSDYHRRPGSMGANSFPSRVFKGKKLPGRMGGQRVTVQNLEVVGIDAENNLMWVKGAVPGANRSWIMVVNAIKHSEQLV